MSNCRFGPYVLSNYSRIGGYMSQWQPSCIVLHDGEAKMENVQNIRAVSPTTKIIGRYYKPDSWYDENIRRSPEDTAFTVAEALRQTNWAHLVDGIITSNEVCQDWSGLPYLNRYYLALQKQVDFPLVLCSFSVEVPGWSASDSDGWHASLMKHWQLVYPSMRAGLKHGDMIGVHQYNANTLILPDEAANDRRIVRYERLVWPYLPKDLKTLPVIVSEFGWDFLLWPYNYKAGWLDPLAASSTEDANGQLSRFASLWDKNFSDIPVVGWVLYSAGDSGGWAYYDMTSRSMPNGESRARPLVELISSLHPGGVWPPVQQPTEPPMDFEQRISQGVEDLGYKIIPLHERADVNLDAMDERASVWVLKDVWTTLDGSWKSNTDDQRPFIWQAPRWASEDYLLPSGHPCYFDDAGGDHHVFGACLPIGFEGSNVDCQLLKGAGFIFNTWQDDKNTTMVEAKDKSGWANIIMFASSNYSPDQTIGPWEWAKFGASDIIQGAGMPWNHHVSWFAVWQEMTVAEYRAKILQPDYETLEDAIIGEGDKSQTIQLQVSAALQRAIYGHGAVPVGNEFTMTYKDVKYQVQKAEFLGRQEERYYWTEFGNWDNIKFIVKTTTVLSADNDIVRRFLELLRQFGVDTKELEDYFYPPI